MTDSVWITVTVKRNRDKELAILVDHGGEKDEWSPRAQIMDTTDELYQEGDKLEIEIPKWLALDKGMI